MIACVEKWTKLNVTSEFASRIARLVNHIQLLLRVNRKETGDGQFHVCHKVCSGPLIWLT